MWIFKTGLLALFAILHVQAVKDVEDTKTEDKSRISKRITLRIFAFSYILYNTIFISVLPIFQVVRFPNDVCAGSTRNGTCFTA